MANTTRRSALATLAAAPFASAAASATPVLLGGPIFLKSDDPVELAREHRRLGYSAAYCPAVKLDQPERVAAIEKAFAAEKVAIAEVGAWINMMDPDAAKRTAAIQYVSDRCALADAVGARCCVDYAGSFNPEVPWGAHPKNFSPEFFDGTVENCRKVIDSVKPKRTRFSLEMEKWSHPSNADTYLRLIRAIDRPNAFAVHIDCTNIVDTVPKFYNTTAVIDETFAKLGRWIMSCHAKDVRWVKDGHLHFEECIPGRGVLDYTAYLKNLARLPKATPLMLEHLKLAEEYLEAATYIRKVAAGAGVAFGS